jgi:hypothetical protein
MTPSFGRYLLWMAVFAAAPLYAQSDSQQGPSIVLGAGVEQTDNAFKSSSDEQDETKEYLNLGLGYLRSGQALSAQIDYNGEFANYENNTTNDDVVLTGSSNLGWSLLPGRLQIGLSHERSEQLRNSRDVDIRNNRQIRDMLSAGPALTARISTVDDLVFSGRLTQVVYDKSGAETTDGQNPGRDSDRVQGGVAWQHRLNKTDLLSANYQYSTSKFDDSDVEMTFQQVFGTYEVRLRNSGYTASLGLNRSERKGGSSSDGFYGQLGWDLTLGVHRFKAVLINQLTDSGIGLGGNSLSSGSIGADDSNFDVVDVVERSSLDLGYGFDGLCERCVVDIGLRYDRQDFDIEPRDQTLSGVTASFGYRLTPTLKASLKTGYTELEFPQDPDGGRKDDRDHYGFSLDWTLSRQLTAQFFLMTDSRDSSQSGVGNYDEAFGGLSVSYRVR